MEQGHFYYLDESYYNDFKDPDIQRNHETINGIVHDKPCFCAFPDEKNDIYWLIPISSKTNKYHSIASQKIRRYGKCDTIIFGNVLGYEKAFLIQNMIPVTEKYIKNEYFSANGKPVRISGVLEAELIKASRDVLNKQRRGIKLIFPDVLNIEKILIDTMK